MTGTILHPPSPAVTDERSATMPRTDAGHPGEAVPTEHGQTRRWGWKVYLGAGLAAIVGHYFVKGAAQPHIYELIGASAVIAIVVGIRRNKPTSALAWWLLGLGQACFLLGDITWNYYQYVRHIELPSPSFADALYLVGYPLLFAALWVLFRQGRGEQREGREGLIDATIVAAAAGAATWLLIVDKYEAQILHSGAIAVAAAYPLMDIFLVGIIARLLFSPGRRTTAFRLLTVSMWSLVVGDIAYAYLLAHAGTLGGSLTSVGWLLSYVFLGAAALHPSARMVLEREGHSTVARLTRGRLAILAIITIAPLLIAVVVGSLDGKVDLNEVAISSTVLFILVLIRMSLLLRHVESAGATERELATIVETSNDAIIGKTLDGIITSWNAGAKAMFGYSAQEMIGRPISLLVPPDLDDDIAPILESLRRGERIQRYTTLRMRKDGTRIHVSLSISPIGSAEGTITGAAVIAQDISEKVRSDEKLKVLQRGRARLLERTINAGEQERKMLAAEIHDGPVQRLTALDVKLETLRDRLVAAAPDSGRMVQGVQGGLQKSILELRRLMVELHPPALRERGLDAALTDYLAGMQRGGIQCHFETALGARLPPDIEITLYRIVQEALMNVMKHARAGEVWVSMHSDDQEVILEVRDDGTGFEMDKGPNHPIGEHYGLIGMRERAEMVGGQWEIHSLPGAGTSVRVRLPMEERHD
jgi:PAS domain S-box-containing protein